MQSKNGVDRVQLTFNGEGSYDIFENNISETQMQYWFDVLHSHTSHWLTKWMAFRFRIIAQYSVNTKFDDALKILVAFEKMAK